MSPKIRLMLTVVLVLSTFLVLTQSASADWFYVVKAGDTLFAIGRRYGVNPYDIARYNHLANPNLIYVGQKLRIPCAGGQPPAPVRSGNIRGRSFRGHSRSFINNVSGVALRSGPETLSCPGLRQSGA